MDYAYWKILLWRLVRGAVATALAQTLALQVNWLDWQSAIQAVVVSFVAGFLVALAKGIRDEFSKDKRGKTNYDSLLHKLPV